MLSEDQIPKHVEGYTDEPRPSFIEEFLRDTEWDFARNEFTGKTRPFEMTILITPGKTTPYWESNQHVSKHSNFHVRMDIFSNEQERVEFIRHNHKRYHV